jgi:hypothetical protein
MNTKKLKPFDLQAALNGEPVMLRNGRKAFVRHHEYEALIQGNFNLVGIIEGRPFYQTWTSDGSYDTSRSDLDIIGMYPTSKTRIINGFEVPAPEIKAPDDGDECYIPSVFDAEYCVGIIWGDYAPYDERALSRGLVFLNKKDEIANAKAMLGIDPYEESE